MNGSRPTPSRPGDRSSLDALNRTIEGLEARIEGLMSGTARDARVPKPADPRLERRPAQPATYREPQFASDPLAEIRERQRMLDASRDRGARPERPRAPELRREEPRHPEPRRTELRPPEAYRPPVRQAPVRAEATRYTET
ncbi:Hypothetical protein, partial CDS, partial [Neorhizobium galegae bv. officinalis]